MNAPANIAAPELSRYADTVRTFLPACHGRELELRCRIMSARENATAAIGRGRCAPEAFGARSEIQRLALEYAYAPASCDELALLLDALRLLLRAAMRLDRFSEGAGGRG
jgi:hypothetical protein